MLLRSTGRLLCPDTLTAKIPMLSNMPHLMTPCSGGGCIRTASQASEQTTLPPADDMTALAPSWLRSAFTRQAVMPDGL